MEDKEQTTQPTHEDNKYTVPEVKYNTSERKWGDNNG